MSIKRKVLVVIMGILGIMAIVLENQVIRSISLVGFTFLILSMKLSDDISRRKLIKKIDKENIECIKVKENNKWVIPLMIVLLFNMYNIIKSRYVGFKHGDNYTITNLLTYTNSFDLYEKVILVIIVVISIFIIINIIQAILNPCIVSKDKVIFYDGIVFDIDKIEEIEYKDSFIKNNKKVIKISKGFIDRKIVTDTENFKKVKNLLECKN
ncbi:hypothetical protein [Paraclostridium bifermentans]|uniref:hypothetical protein n=3 Tax=Paraclostridium bifermentans TaxID=1490 RepID=UPI00038D671B|nr:hypothetical protein [Paraclostridium bifermentans]EQK47305.1 hypothetical protein C671_0840 [[Clostridium] bifermentans ATCC 19299] [Paraclostridium bifermentans ATCC 19299]TQO55957.1 hypothetical protein D5S05_16050 [Paraclostridium bifermentans]UOW69518.1 hypothetical protein MTR78_16050 [Paraclostridium bifermentans]GKZ02757.1 hypothetical protein ANS014_11910 [Paraclostridium bifermentans]GKZ05431.1 hypothetical protein ANS015_03140 [Paraclostridium bifermentans]